MKYKTFIVTGASQGIGRATALGLASVGAEVIIICRDLTRGLRACQEIIEQSHNPLVHLETADLSSIKEINHLGERLASRFPLLHGLVNNHAALFPDYVLSVDNLEMNFALNHLSYFLLTNLLLENLKRGGGRIVNVTAHVHTNVTDAGFLENPVSPETYNPWDAYCQSKLANILFTYALAGRLAGTGVTANCLHPGSTPTLALKTAREIYSRLHGATEFPPTRTIETAAETSLYLATSPEVDGVTGKYFMDCKAVPSSDLSHDISLQERLWEVSSRSTQLRQEA